MPVVRDFEPAGTSFETLYASLRETRATQPVFYSETYNGWIITRYDDLVAVVNSDGFSVVGAGVAMQNGQYCQEAQAVLATGVDWQTTKHVQSSEGEDHARFRRAIMSVLTPRRIRSIEPSVRQIVIDLIDGISKTSTFDFISSFAYPLAMKTTLRMIGFEDAERDMDKLPKWIDDTFRLKLSALSDAQQVDAMTSAISFQNYISTAIRDRIDNPRDDLLSDIIGKLSTGEFNLTFDELVIMFTHSFVGASQETTKLGLTNMIYHLLSQPKKWEEVKERRVDIPKVVEECLRFDTPLLAWFRICVQDSFVGGKKIKKGEKVVLMFGSANHDGEKYENSEELCPFREMRPMHLTFNTGKHFCAGAGLARMELRLALEELTARLPTLRLCPNQTIEYAPNFGNRAIRTLQLEW